MQFIEHGSVRGASGNGRPYRECLRYLYGQALCDCPVLRRCGYCRSLCLCIQYFKIKRQCMRCLLLLFGRLILFLQFFDEQTHMF